MRIYVRPVRVDGHYRRHPHSRKRSYVHGHHRKGHHRSV